jgi:[ribosomal protein S5]-alanine N-acetyltransferase
MASAIYSERLELIPMTPAFLRASLNRAVHEAGQELGISPPKEWPGENTDVVALRLRQLETDPTLQPWLLRAMVIRATRVMVGHIGFHTAPDPDYLRPLSPGGVEFGFSVFPAFRRQGYAREAAIALMRWALQTHGVKRFVLSIRPDNAPSQGLAAQLGFARVGSHIDEVDGLEEILELRA